MIVRSPLAPWSIASHSMSRSQTCQSGLAHLPATNAKSRALIPSPIIRLTKRWPNTRTRSRTPETRMNSHAYISVLVRPRRRRGERGAASGDGGAVVISSTPEHVREVTDHERHVQHDPGHSYADEHVSLVARALGPEVDEDQPQAVERGEQDRCHEAVLEESYDRVLVGGDDLVVGLRRDSHESGVEDVGEQEEEDPDAGDAMGDPGPHPVLAAIERPSRRLGHVLSPSVIGVRGSTWSPTTRLRGRR